MNGLRRGWRRSDCFWDGVLSCSFVSERVRFEILILIPALVGYEVW